MDASFLLHSLSQNTGVVLNVGMTEESLTVASRRSSTGILLVGTGTIRHLFLHLSVDGNTFFCSEFLFKESNMKRKSASSSFLWHLVARIYMVCRRRFFFSLEFLFQESDGTRESASESCL